MGDIDGKETDEVVQVIEERRGVYRKLVVRDGRLAGAVLVGDASAAPGLIQRFDRGDPLPANRLDLFASPDRGSAPTDDMVCHCHQVSEGQLSAAVRGGCRSLQDIAAKTGAGTGCGSCRGKLASLLLKAAPPTAAESSRHSLEVV
jgi:nitrite reductase (NADH) large subunit